MSSRDSRPHSGSSRSRSDHDSRPHRDHKDKYRSEGDRGPGGSRNDRDRYDGHVRNRSRSPNTPRDLSPHGIDDQSRRRDDRKDVEEAVPPPPPPPRITKISMGFTKPAAAPMKMSLSAGGGGGGANSKRSLASVFNADSDDDDEEMPAEARMRMRNIGRETPTSAGPNSFGKTKHGFCDSKKVFEKNMKQAMDSSGPKGQKPTPKFPQTVYKLSSS